MTFDYIKIRGTIELFDMLKDSCVINRYVYIAF